MTKIRIIDLLNKIANGDIELGTKFNWHYKWHDIELIFTERQAALGLYFQQEDRLIGLFERFNYQILNDEVEIIEEDKKIEKFFTYYDDDLEEYIVETRINGNRIKEHFGSPYEQMVLNKFNEIIDYLMENKQ